MSAYYAPDTVLDTRNIVINKETKISPSSGTSTPKVLQETISLPFSITRSVPDELHPWGRDRPWLTSANQGFPHPGYSYWLRDEGMEQLETMCWETCMTLQESDTFFLF